ncbi:DNA polymerase III subunit chi [Rhodobacter xanthinilyticus]|uniref:DNA polymerase III subunit chi n=1 Tax=Rhodobacter xanthinilyticus TaxID=1850250 RepID=A0A1D9MD26_9RHOB|nr:DNA polymerase III subunit chi [Rhodobacter xanthinilyticus]
MPALFYHVTQSPVEDVVAMLLARALEQGWRVELRGRAPDQMARFDHRLWLGPEEGFLAHGLAGGPHDALQPVLLTTGPVAGAGRFQAVMSVHGAEVSAAETEAHERVWILFDGHDGQAVEHARGQWRALTRAGAKAQYWNDESGRWQKKAEA